MEMPKDIKEFMNSLRVTKDGSLVFDAERLVFTTGVLPALSLFAVPVERFGSTLRPVLRRALTRYGRKRAMRDEGLGARKALEKYLAESYLTGFGRVELVEFGRSRVVFRVYGSLYGEEAGNYLRSRGVEAGSVCTQGFIAEGILNYFAEKEGETLFVAQEVKCKAKGDEYCEFILEREE